MTRRHTGSLMSNGIPPRAGRSPFHPSTTARCSPAKCRLGSRAASSSIGTSSTGLGPPAFTTTLISAYSPSYKVSSNNSQQVSAASYSQREGLFKIPCGLLYKILMDYSYPRIYRYCRRLANNLDQFRLNSLGCFFSLRKSQPWVYRLFLKGRQRKKTTFTLFSRHLKYFFHQSPLIYGGRSVSYFINNSHT